MDIQKHGGVINLPQRLIENLPKRHQQLFASKNIDHLPSCAESRRDGPRHQQKPTQSIPNRTKRLSMPVQMVKRAVGAIGQRGMKRIGKRASQSPEVLIQDQSRSMRVSLGKPPGQGWEPKKISYSTQNRLHWLSPSRRIEFTKRSHACQFEKMRERYGIDERKAWLVYRKNFSPTFVVDAHQYD